MEVLKEHVVLFVKEHFMAVVIAVLGITFLLYGAVSFYYASTPSEDVSFDSQPTEDAVSEKPQISPKEAKKSLVIDIAGAVNNPGVYTVPAGSRVQDVIIAAGGLSKDVDRQRIAQTLNLASNVSDGAKVYVPLVGDQMVTSGGVSSNTSGSSSTVLGASTSIVNINSASLQELDALPGVGEVTANKIIANRPYETVEDLVKKKVVGQAVFGKIKDMVTVN